MTRWLCLLASLGSVSMAFGAGCVQDENCPGDSVCGRPLDRREVAAVVPSTWGICVQVQSVRGIEGNSAFDQIFGDMASGGLAGDRARRQAELERLQIEEGRLKNQKLRQEIDLGTAGTLSLERVQEILRQEFAGDLERVGRLRSTLKSLLTRIHAADNSVDRGKQIELFSKVFVEYERTLNATYAKILARASEL